MQQCLTRPHLFTREQRMLMLALRAQMLLPVSCAYYLPSAVLPAVQNYCLGCGVACDNSERAKELNVSARRELLRAVRIRSPFACDQG